MKLLAILSDEAFAVLLHCAPRDVDIRRIRYSELEGRLNMGAFGLVVLDPDEISEQAFARAVFTISRLGCRLILFAKRHKLAHLRILSANREIPVTVVLWEIDGEPAIIAGLLRKHDECVSTYVLQGIGELLRAMQTEICRATLALFAWAPIPKTVHDLAISANAASETIRVSYRNAGLCAPNSALITARLARMYPFLGDSKERLDVAAAANGFGTLRSLERHTQKYFGQPPRKVSRELDVAAYASRLIGVLTR